MTRAEFEEFDGTSMIEMLDGRMGLCPHWTNEGVRVDTWGAAPEPEEIDVPWACIEQVRPGFLREVARCS
jgi:hypothetical protein